MYLENNFHPLLMICKHCLLRAYFLSNASVHSVLYAECFNFFLNFFNFTLEFCHCGTYLHPSTYLLLLGPACIGMVFVIRIHSLETHPPRGIALSPSELIIKFSSVHFLDLLLYSSSLDYTRHPRRMIRPLCGHILDSSILDFQSSSSWDGSSIWWTYFISIHFGLYSSPS